MFSGLCRRIGRTYMQTAIKSNNGWMMSSNSGWVSSGKSMSTYRMTFVEASGEEIDVEFAEDDTILDVALDNDIDIEGACGGECACSTCHVILEQDTFDQLPEPDEEEEDMLDLALGLTDTSRLGCQIKLTPAQDGMRVILPAETESMLG